MMTRFDGCTPTQLRPVRLTVDVLDYAEGSSLTSLAEQGIAELLELQQRYV